jgi:hypothetical protein
MSPGAVAAQNGRVTCRTQVRAPDVIGPQAGAFQLHG